MIGVTLAPYTDDQRDALCALIVKPEQEQFSGQPEALVSLTETEVDLYLILRDDTLVGMFRIDTGYSRSHSFAENGSMGLRSVIVGAKWQGCGIGTAMLRDLPGFLRKRYPDSADIYLTVNLRNNVARAIYIKGGFTDTGQHYLGGSAGGVCQRSCPPISCGVSDFWRAGFAFRVQPNGSGGLPIAGLS